MLGKDGRLYDPDFDFDGDGKLNTYEYSIMDDRRCIIGQKQKILGRRLMKRVNNLNLYQRLLLTIMPAMALVFAILYSITISKVGFYYKNTILKPIQENDCVIYSGKIEGQPTCFTVSEDKKSCFNMVQQRMDCIR